jgi:hypothetical protein
VDKQHIKYCYLARKKSYAKENKSNTNQVEDTAITLTKFLDEFKGLFNQLLQKIA